MTSSRPAPPAFTPRGLVLGKAVAATLVATLMVGAVGAVFAADGSRAAIGAALGGVMAAVVFAVGAAVVDVVASAEPTLSLMVALSTYTLQVVAVLALFVAADRSVALREVAELRWSALATVVAALTWMSACLGVVWNARIPVYDVPVEPAHRTDGRGA